MSVYTTHERSGTLTLHGYGLLLPDTYDANRVEAYPTILYFHGAGEAGTDLALVDNHGPCETQAMKDWYGDTKDFIILLPQTTDTSTEWDGKASQINDFVDEMVGLYNIDQGRIYWTGLSAGSDIIITMCVGAPWSGGAPKITPAAVAPIAGSYSNPDGSQDLEASFWFFRRKSDSIAWFMAEACDHALSDVNPTEVRMTQFTGSSHGGWTYVYRVGTPTAAGTETLDGSTITLPSSTVITNEPLPGVGDYANLADWFLSHSLVVTPPLPGVLIDTIPSQSIIDVEKVFDTDEIAKIQTEPPSIDSEGVITSWAPTDFPVFSGSSLFLGWCKDDDGYYGLIFNLRAEYRIQKLYIWDYQGTPTCRIGIAQTTNLSDYTTVYEAVQNTYNQPRTIDVDQNAFAIKVELDEAGLIPKFFMFGYEIGEVGDHNPTPVDVTVIDSIDGFAGTNNFVDYSASYYPVKVERDYYYNEWMVNDAAQGALTEANMECVFDPPKAGIGIDDAVYLAKKNAGITLHAVLNYGFIGLAGNYDGATYDRERKPLDTVGADPTDPNSYKVASKFMFNFAARYGSNTNVTGLQLAAGQTSTVGLDYVSIIEPWNEGDKNWGTEDRHFRPQDLAAFFSAVIDGHNGTFGAGFGILTADPNMKVSFMALIRFNPEYVDLVLHYMASIRGQSVAQIEALFYEYSFHHYFNDAGGQGSGATTGLSPEAANIETELDDLIYWRDTEHSGKKINWSEFGWDTNVSVQRATALINSSREETQAAWILRSFIIGYHKKIDRMVQYMLIDLSTDDTLSALYQMSGFRKSWDAQNPFLPKHSLYAMETFTFLCGVCNSIEKRTHSDSEVSIYKLSGTTKKVYAIWLNTSSDNSKSIDVDVDEGSAERVDIVFGQSEGSRSSVTITNGTISSFHVTEQVVFIDADSSEYTGTTWSIAELRQWRDRAVNGPYKTEDDQFTGSPGSYDECLARADDLVNDVFVDYYNTNYTDNSSISESPVYNGHNILAAAFIYLITSDDSYGNKAKTSLLTQITAPNIQWNVLYYPNDSTGGNYAFAGAMWYVRLFNAFEYIKPLLSASEITDLETFFYDGAVYFKTWVHQVENSFFPNRLSRDYSVKQWYANDSWATPYWTDTTSADNPQAWTHKNASDVFQNQMPILGTTGWNNRHSFMAMAYGLYGSYSSDATLIDEAKIYFEEWIKYSVFPDGTTCEYHRNGDYGRPDQGVGFYNPAQIHSFLVVADALARTGDDHLFTYSSGGGLWGTEGGQKNIKLVLDTLASHVDQSELRYYDTVTSETLLDLYQDAGPEIPSWPNGVQFIPDLTLGLANLAFQSNYYTTIYLRTATGSTPYDPIKSIIGLTPSIQTGHAAAFPAVSLQTYEMESYAPYTVDFVEVAPTVNAGEDDSITLPTDSIEITGSYVAGDGSIVSTVWTQISGPNTAGLSGDTTLILTASGLIEGTYVFRLTVTDDTPLNDYDEVSIVVLPEPVEPKITGKMNMLFI